MEIGFPIHRGPLGIEAFDADDCWLGIFASRQEAVRALPAGRAE
jgi:hypothetical protein